MDKNTIWGLLVMAVIFFGFMYFSPKKEPTQTDAGQSAKAPVEQPATPVAQQLSDTELGWLRDNIRAHGTATRAENGVVSYTLTQNALHLTLTGDSLSGTVTLTNGNKVDYAEVVNPATTLITVAEQSQALDLIRRESNTAARYGRFAPFTAGKDTVITMENEVLALQLSAKSGTITRAELKKYDTEYDPDETKHEKRRVVLFEGKSNAMDFAIPLPQPVNTSGLYFRPSRPNDTTVLMTLDLGNGAYWGLRYTMPKGDNYVVDIDVVQHGVAPLVQSNNRTMAFTWHQNIARQEKGRMFEERQSALYYKFAGGSVENLSENSDDNETKQNKVRWIGFKNQFFSSVMVSHRPFATADFRSQPLKDTRFLKSMNAEATINDYDWNAPVPVRFSLFMGPNSYPLLSDLDDTVQAGEDLDLTRMIPLGWSIFRWINTGVIIPIFTFLGQFISNYGIIILLLTLFIKLVLFPLTYKSMISQARMRILAPDIKAINDKYPGKEQAMTRQQKTMALYSQAGASPLSGCLPMLLQLPILFAMFSFFPSCIELRGQSFLWAHDLSAPDAIISWSGNIPVITEYFGNHVSLFCLLMTVTNIIFTHMNMQNQSQQMPGMKWMMYLMPVFFMVFFNNYASGLSCYYFMFLLLTIAQTYIFRSVVKEDDVRRKMAENAKKPKRKSGFMARLEEMQRQQQEALKAQQSRNSRRR